MPRRPPLFIVLIALALVAAACSGEESSDTTASTAATTTESEFGGHEAHGMDIEIGTVDDVAALGAGPSVGERWEIPIGVNVCGRFIETPSSDPVGGVAAGEGATAVVEPVDEASSGHGATLGDYAESAGISLSTGEIGLPTGIVPPVIEVTGTDVPLDGATFRTGDLCGENRGEVQVWVYSADAVQTGRGLLTVVTDPERIPFVEEGMALVLAFAPESSLPTLPPSALDLN